MLREKDTKWLEIERPRLVKKRIAFSNDDRRKDNQIRRKTRKALDDLAYFANHLADKQFRQVFTVESLQPLISAVLNKTPDKDQKLLFAELLIKEAIKIQPFVPGRPGQIDLDAQKVEKILEHSFALRGNSSKRGDI